MSHSNPFGGDELVSLGPPGSTPGLAPGGDGLGSLGAPAFSAPPSGGLDGRPVETSGGFVQQAEKYLPAMLQGSSHPFVAFFHLAFKVGAIVVYLVGRNFTGSFVKTFILVVLLLAFDFWTVKNVTGRILVGLRWWSSQTEDGKTEWVFESRDERQPPPNSMDSLIFWGGLYAWPLLWGVFFVVNLFSFSVDWLVLIVMALTFAGSNLAGYWKCSKDQKNKLTEQVTTWGMGLAKSGFAQRVVSNFV